MINSRNMNSLLKNFLLHQTFFPKSFELKQAISYHQNFLLNEFEYAFKDVLLLMDKIIKRLSTTRKITCHISTVVLIKLFNFHFYQLNV